MGIFPGHTSVFSFVFAIFSCLLLVYTVGPNELFSAGKKINGWQKVPNNFCLQMIAAALKAAASLVVSEPQTETNENLNIFK